MNEKSQFHIECAQNKLAYEDLSKLSFFFRSDRNSYSARTLG